jgi:hypothetical protein
LLGEYSEAKLSNQTVGKSEAYREGQEFDGNYEIPSQQGKKASSQSCALVRRCLRTLAEPTKLSQKRKTDDLDRFREPQLKLFFSVPNCGFFSH